MDTRVVKIMFLCTGRNVFVIHMHRQMRFDLRFETKSNETKISWVTHSSQQEGRCAPDWSYGDVVSSQ
jgi:hypothetical protein